MIDCEGFMGTYLAEGNSRDWLDQLSVHCLTHENMLLVGQEIHPIHVREEKSLVANLAKPFVILVIKNNLILLDRVTKEEVGLP